jgi:hypothetical protein
MKYVLPLLFLAAAPALAMNGQMTTLPYQPQANRPALPNSAPVPYVDLKKAKIRHELSELHDEGVKLREADGGTLTEEHRAYLQAKLDAIGDEAAGR